MTKSHTLEERIKFDHGLKIGQSLVKFTLGERNKLALVEISNRGEVWYFAKPDSGDLYTSWSRVRGDDTLSGSGATKVWAWKDIEFMARFDHEPAAVIPLILPEPFANAV